ncbi:MAG: DUF2752 domain-containing protein [Blastocatellia bacterium]|nr:DUF2752 domain-containing protein [Blastocatellia bacterium]
MTSGTTRVVSALGVVAFVAGSAVVALNDPSKATFFPICPLLSLTGFACPGCGLTRGFHALFNGDIPTALDFNLLLPIWLVLFGWIFVSLGLTAVRGRGLQMPVLSGKTVWMATGILLTFGVLRNMPWYPLTVLYP